MLRPNDDRLNGDRFDGAVDWHGLHVVVAGGKIVGSAATPVLLRLGCRVTVIDEKDTPEVRERMAGLAALGATTLIGSVEQHPFPADAQVVIVSPGFPPNSPLLQAALAVGAEIWGDVEFAWRLAADARRRGVATPVWLCLTGTNGKTTTVKMLESMLRAGGVRAVAAGNVGLPLTEAVQGHDGLSYEALAVELSSFQLHYATSMRAQAAAVLNIAPDHLDWHGGLDEYAASKRRIYTGVSVAVANQSDVVTVELLQQAEQAGELAPGATCVTFTRAEPQPGQVGIRDGWLIDRAFAGQEAPEGLPLAPVSVVRPAAPHNVENALAAATLARAYGVAGEAIAEGLRQFVPEPHRIAHVATIDGVDYVDDSKATNTHAAEASLRAYPDVVWIAGGLAKGASFDDLVVAALPMLRGVVLLGQDRGVIAEALARHAPELPCIEVTETGDAAMTRIVHEARSLAAPGTTVLLAPACASMDMFANYNARGVAFAEAVTRLAAAIEGPTSGAGG